MKSPQRKKKPAHVVNVAQPSLSTKIAGARTNNLKNISLDIPHDQITVITGPSGCGKSSLAIDTIFAEGQRQYLETLSLFARQYVEQFPRPDVDSIDGLLPTLLIDQQSQSHNPRSTVGTVTEIHDYLRVLMARAGDVRCYGCGQGVKQQSSEQITRWICNLPEQTKTLVLSPVVRGRKGGHAEVFERVRSERLVRVRVDGQVHDIEYVPELDPKKSHSIEAVTDRIVVRPGIEPRLAESIELALRLSGGLIGISYSNVAAADAIWNERLFSTKFACPDCDLTFAEIEPRTFSFNSPYGACAQCEGLGRKERIDRRLLISDATRSLESGAIDAWRTLGKAAVAKRLKGLLPALQSAHLQSDSPLNSWSDKQWLAVWNGDDVSKTSGLQAILDEDLIASDNQRYVDRLQQAVATTTCNECLGSRLGPVARSVLLGGLSISQISNLPVGKCLEFLNEVTVEQDVQPIAQPLIREIMRRMKFLVQVGLDYLTLDRSADTLSGGEHQRVRLASSIGAGLTNVCFVLDEPTAGLHSRDTLQLIDVLEELRAAGNTILVVEHDESLMRSADKLIDMGPGAGRTGGTIVDEGRPSDVIRRALGLTGQYLAAVKSIPVPTNRRKCEPANTIQLRGATGNNLKSIDVAIPTGLLVAVTGVSGSGKSTLINGTLIPALRKSLGLGSVAAEPYGSIKNAQLIDKLVAVDQRPIGRTPRGCPATYTGLFDEIRNLFAATKVAKQLGFGPKRFSFNSADGWCPDCRGHGKKKIEMNFLPDLYVTCTACNGSRFNRQTLTVRFRDMTIAQVLNLSVEAAAVEFDKLTKIRSPLLTLLDVGLGYMQLGQPSTTLSGGEAQRIKLAAELAQHETGRTLYVLDEPTTGLHFEDIGRLLGVLHQLVDRGNTVVVIEHHLDVIKSADWVIDVGPEGGDSGGKVVAVGTPEQIANVSESHTGQFLAKSLR